MAQRRCKAGPGPHSKLAWDLPSGSLAFHCSLCTLPGGSTLLGLKKKKKRFDFLENSFRLPKQLRMERIGFLQPHAVSSALVAAHEPVFVHYY